MSEAGTGSLKTIAAEDLTALTEQARGSPRGRMNANLHPRLSDPVQRFFNAIEPGSYVRPHRHLEPLRWELFAALQGRAVVLQFDGRGEISARVELAPAGPVCVVEIPAGVWHTVAALERGTVLLEIKEGPYSRTRDKDFAPWAPAEGAPDAAATAEWFRSATVGDTAPHSPN